MANKDHATLLRQGVPAWNRWRDANPSERPDLSRTRLAETDLTGADLRGADLGGADLSLCALPGARLAGANLTGARLTGADAREADLSGSSLSRSDLRGADLTAADLRTSHLDGTCLTEALLDLAVMENAHLSGAHLGRTSLKGADLKGADLREADLKSADLSGADLSGSDLSEADLRGACLTAARLNGARLTAANLSSANMAGALLRSVDLTGVHMFKTDLRGAVLSGSRVHGLLAQDLSTDGETDQSDLVVTRPGQSAVIVDSLEMAQFTSLFFDNASIRGLVEAMATRAVLVLGTFPAERAWVWEAIKKALHDAKLSPVRLDVRPQDAGSLAPTVDLLLRMARFVVLETADPAGIPPGFGTALAATGRTPVLPLRAAGQPHRQPPAEWDGAGLVLGPQEYEDRLSLSLRLANAIRKVDKALRAVTAPPGASPVPIAIARRGGASPDGTTGAGEGREPLAPGVAAGATPVKRPVPSFPS